MNLHVITVAYCRSAQLARMLLEFRKVSSPCLFRHIIVQGHYPIDRERNNKEIELIVKSYGLAELWDPGSNLGSSQSQQWALDRLGYSSEDYWVNLDPDSACRDGNWLHSMKTVLDHATECAVISCNAPMVEALIKSRSQQWIRKYVDGVNVGILDRPTPFNLSMWKCSFVKEIGGIQQYYPWWGELEAPIHAHAAMRGMYHAYLLDHMECEEGKFFHPASNGEWKNRHARTEGPSQFIGNYEEFLRYAYPQLSELKL